MGCCDAQAVAAVTEASIDAMREKYVSVADTACVLFFSMNALQHIDSMYQVSRCHGWDPSPKCLRPFPSQCLRPFPSPFLDLSRAWLGPSMGALAHCQGCSRLIDLWSLFVVAPIPTPSTPCNGLRACIWRPLWPQTRGLWTTSMPGARASTGTSLGLSSPGSAGLCTSATKKRLLS
jgi:hypothetical protein